MSLAQRLAPFGTTIFTEMTRLAQQHNAVNLAQGFPDFDGPDVAKQAAAAAIAAGHNQYARMFGVPALNAAIADDLARRTGRVVDPDTQITVTSGCTEAIAACMLGLLNPGDEIILFEPFYDSYRATIAMAAAVPRFVTLRPTPAGFVFDEGELRAAFTPRTRAILINTPHNPTGKVFTRAELECIASLCRTHGVIAITDEVYERLTFEPALPHIPLATLEGMAERTITLSSIGKTYSLTGWKVGWAIAPPPLTAAVRAAHQFLTFATATPLQHGSVAALRQGEPDVAATIELFRANRAALSAALVDLGFAVYPSHGTYFLMSDLGPLERVLRAQADTTVDDRAAARYLTQHVGVAAIPPSVFYNEPRHGSRLLRWAFCKKHETIATAIQRLRTLAGA
jgi:aspartate/methionine/tyrosine aminotransferase